MDQRATSRLDSYYMWSAQSIGNALQKYVNPVIENFSNSPISFIVFYISSHPGFLIRSAEADGVNIIKHSNNVPFGNTASQHFRACTFQT